MKIRHFMTGMAALVGLAVYAAEGRAGGYAGCTTCGPANHLAHTMNSWHAKVENCKGCAVCNPRDPFYCGSTGVNGSNGYCNQRLQHVRRIGVLMNHNEFMGDSWLHRYNGGFNFTPPNPYTRPVVGTTFGK